MKHKKLLLGFSALVIFITLSILDVYMLELSKSIAQVEIDSKSYLRLFQSISMKCEIEEPELQEFAELISEFLEKLRAEFGETPIYFANRIAIRYASLVVGIAEGNKRNRISKDDITMASKYFDKVYLDLYSHKMPLSIIQKYPDISPLYTHFVDFEKVKGEYSKLLDISDLIPPQQLLVAESLTGIAVGVALVSNREILTKNDLEIAKRVVCEWWPECKKWSGLQLMKFSREYVESLTKD
jgi:hypothetical protein